MSRGIQRSRLDGNQKAIVDHLRAFGVSVLSLANVGNGCPDIIAGYRHINVLLELKDPAQPPSKRKLTPLEAKFRDAWRGQYCVVETCEEALAAVFRAAKTEGRLR